MNNLVYSNRMCSKLEALLPIYCKMMYKKIDILENLKSLETTEHYRLPPKEGFKSIKAKTRWGGEWVNLWLSGNYTVKKEHEGKKIYLLPKVNAVEILCFLDDKPFGIINSKNGDLIGGNHPVQQITDCGVSGKSYKIDMECYAGQYTPGSMPYDNYDKDTTDYDTDEFYHDYESIDICVLQEEIFGFVFDLKAILQMNKVLPCDNKLKNDAREVLEKVFCEIIQFPSHCTDEEVIDAVTKCRKVMKDILSDTCSEKTRGSMGIIGHSHMDTAWHWPVKETIRKCARTYSNALHLMDLYPEYMFIQSSALHTEWMRKFYPDIFDGIKKQVANGRYEPNGGVWVECDCNVTSGEFMIRQFLKGQHYTRKYFNYTSDCFWLPDTFGYNAAIPQIMKICGIDYFYTTKIRWGDMNSFPYDTFYWKGIDGTSVLTHYNTIHRSPDVESAHTLVNKIPQKHVYDKTLLSFGFGDGGGGPTEGMLEDARRAQNIQGLPEVYYTTASEFMRDIEKNARDIPMYNDELYLELHRGTLTQIHDHKRNNRKAEFSMTNLDFLNVLACEKKNEKSEELLETILINQFHDIVPGTSTKCVNDQTRAEMTQAIAQLNIEADKYMSSLTDGNVDFITAFNTLSFDRNENIYLENNTHIKGKPYQSFTDIHGNELTVCESDKVSAFSAISFAVEKTVENTQNSSFNYENNTLITPYAKVSFDEKGFINSLYDTVARREVKRDGANSLGVFYIAEDVPAAWDNWDIDYDIKLKYRTDAKLISRKIISDGMLEFRIRNEYSIGRKSKITQDMIFHSNTPRVDFHNLIDWKEKHALLKVGFDVDILSRTIKNEIQFGHIDRPTTENHNLDISKYEICNYKWSDISEGRYGVAVLNDCKYGLSVSDSDIRLTLLKGGCHPDPTGDEGVHEVLYSLLAHEGAMNTANVIKPAYQINVPMLIANGNLKKEIPSLISIEAENVICESIKYAELKDNAYILRLYETEKSKTSTLININKNIKKAYIANALEDIICEIPIENSSISITLKPFEIKTIILVK